MRSRRVVTTGARHLRIAFVVDTIGAPVGGGITSAARVVERLRERHDVVVVGADAAGPQDIRLPELAIPVRAVREMGFHMARPVRARIAEAVAGADVVHLQLPFWSSFAALAEAARQGKPVVAGFHVQPENVLASFGVHARWAAEALYRFWVASFYEHVDTVIAPSELAARKLREHGLRAPVVVISNGVPADAVPGPRVREPAHGGGFLLLTVGRFASEKRQELLLQALARSRHGARIRAVIAGAGPRERELTELASRLPHPPEVGFQGRVRLLSLMRSADLLVHTSDVELEGIAVLEAMGTGLPALIAEGPESAASELALDSRFLFRGGDARDLADKLDALLDDPAALAAARPRCLARAATRSADDALDELVKLYRRLARRG